MLTSTKLLLSKAKSGKYAVPALNVNNLEFIKAITEVCEEMRSPVIIQASEGAIKYAGGSNLMNLARNEAAVRKIPVAMHLDHGKDLSIIKKAIYLGFTSVMVDGSHETFSKNIQMTRKVVEMARPFKVSVEAELGTIGGVEDTAKSKGIILTNAEDAYRFLRKTNIDSLAVAIGTSHGAHKFKGKPKLDIKRLKEINELVSIPLVLHGASSLPKKLIDNFKKSGGKISHANGVPYSQIKKAIANGICKVNVDTDLRIAFTTGVRNYLKKHKDVIDYRDFLSEGIKEVKKVVREKIKQFGSGGMA